ncbi:MAG TPA: right-handed parallel beta-helix repeat-containing protein [Thermoanaerobaculia bacterium]|jgi:hypothetical protein
MARTLSFLVLFLVVSLPVTAQQVFVVTNTHDSGPGSFRAALENVAAADQYCFCRVEFRMAEPLPDQGVYTIRLQSPLPIIELVESLLIDASTQTALTGDTNPTGPEVTIDGSALTELAPGLRMVDCAACEVRELGIRHFRGNGIHLDRGRSAIFRGLDVSDNGWNGLMFVNSYGLFVNSSSFRRNGSNGIFSRASSATTGTNLIEGNGANGMDVSGTGPRELTVLFSSDSVITGNAHHGVRVQEGSAFLSTRDRIWGNGLMPIERGPAGPTPTNRTDANPDLPVVRIAEGVQGLEYSRLNIRGSVTVRPDSDVHLTFYYSPAKHPLGFAEGQFVIAERTMRADANGVLMFDSELPANAIVQPLPAVGFISVSARDFDWGSSELSEPVPFRTNALVVSSTADSGPGSLRAAIEAANARQCTPADACWIATALEEGAVIEPTSPLPGIVKEDVRIDFQPGVELLGRSAGNTDGLLLQTSRAYVTGLRVRGFARNGLVVNASSNVDLRILLLDSQFHENENGVVLRGGRRRTNLFGEYNLLYAADRIEASANRGHGIVIEGDYHRISRSKAEDNGGHGVFVGSGVLQVISDMSAKRNRGAGIASAPGAYGVSVYGGSIENNGGLGIDRNADGVTPNDETEADKILDAPAILSARYDPAKQRTVVTYTNWNQVRPNIVDLLATYSIPGAATFFYASDTPDPSGRGEGQQRLDPVPIQGNAPTSPTATFEFPIDLRGRWITAVRALYDCHSELGCTELDSSEFSVAVKVE